MALDRDPYAVLGLPRSATLEEVKRAYRRLAKANHPDAAGEAALPRFLAIQAAYTKIVEPPATGAVRAATRPPSRPWEADPSRANATHRAYGGRGRRTRPSPGPRPAGDPGASSAEAPPRAGGPGSGGGPRPGTGDAAGAGAATGAGAGPSSTGAGPRAGGGTTSGPRSTSAAPNKATLGSTSYDGADAEPFEPDWGGASWYGTSSGTYWMLNPKEYADPRKHGPEYQARARRKLGSRQAETGGSEGPPPGMTDGVVDGEPTDDAEAVNAPPMTGPPPGSARDSGSPDTAPLPRSPGPSQPPASTRSAGSTRSPVPPASTDARAGKGSPGRPTHRTTSWWATASPATADAPSPDTGPHRPASTTDPGDARATAPAPGRGSSALDETTSTIRDWLDGADTGLAGRVGRAVIGWAPLALGIGWLAGEVTGCARFSATCDAAVAPISWLAQLGVLLLLLLVPRLATVATVATAVTLAAAIPGTLLLSATGGATDAASGREALGGLLVIAWLLGVGLGVARDVRRSGAAPVS